MGEKVTELTASLLELQQLEGRASELRGEPVENVGLTGGKPNRRIIGSSDYGLYYDSKGILTSGSGHKVLPTDDLSEHLIQTKDQSDVRFMSDVNARMPEIKKAIPKFDSLNEKTRDAIRNSWFRGSMKNSTTTLKQINSGDFSGAAEEFLNNDEYRDLLSNDPKNGIIGRMEATRDALKSQSVKPKGTIHENILKQPLPEDFTSQLYRDAFNMKVTKIKEAPNTIYEADKVTKHVGNLGNIPKSDDN